MGDYFGSGNETKGLEAAGFGKTEDYIIQTPFIPLQAAGTIGVAHAFKLKNF